MNRIVDNKRLNDIKDLNKRLEKLEEIEKLFPPFYLNENALWMKKHSKRYASKSKFSGYSSVHWGRMMNKVK